MKNQDEPLTLLHDPLTFRQQLILAALSGFAANAEVFRGENHRVYFDSNARESTVETLARLSIAAANAIIEKENGPVDKR